MSKVDAINTKKSTNMEETITHQEVLNQLKIDLKSAVDIFEKELFDKPKYSKFCYIHKHLENREKDHNCLGCNFNGIIMYTQAQLIQSLKMDNIQYIYFQILIALYLSVERIDTILNVINLNPTYRKKHFKAIVRVRKWANFIKHPKSFMLCHHPHFIYNGFPKNSKIRKEYSQIIDESFVLKYYSNDEKNDELTKELENKEKILVIFPNIKKLISEFVKESEKFIEIIEKNQVYREILSDRTTFTDFYFEQSSKENNNMN